MRSDLAILADARARLDAARAVAVLTGAGISAESGVPTFRGASGLWRTHRAEDLATPGAFARDPRLVWEWYDWRRGLVGAAEPNPGHRALVALERRVPAFTLVTQNVDGLHARAGSRNVIHLHGSLWMLRCVGCGAEREDRTAPLPALPPRCACGALERPGVVWFGEPLPAGALERAAEAVATADVVLVVGTSAVVWPAAGLVPLALDRGVPVIEVNVEATTFSDRTIGLRGPAGTILPRLVDAPSGSA
jgi:NAD-dependent deacetylase